MTSREYTNCKLCNADDTRELFTSWEMFYNLDAEQKEKFTFVECRSCGLVYLNPRVPPSAMAAFYPRDYIAHVSESPGAGGTSRGRSDSVIKNLLRPLVRFCRRAGGLTSHAAASFVWRKRHVNGIGGDRFDPARLFFDHLTGKITATIMLQKIWLRVYGGQRRVRYDPLTAPGDGMRLVEIGTGVGRYLESKKAQGWEVSGVEPGAEAVAVCRKKGLDVREGHFKAEDWGANVADAIVIRQVIEHVPDAKKLLEDAYHVLKPGGLIFITTPNWRSIPARLWKTYWIGADAPRHYVLFSPASLQRMLVATRFTPNRWYTLSSVQGYTCGFEFFFREGLGYNIPRDSIRKHWLLTRVFVPLVRLVDFIGLGDGLYITARKDPLIKGASRETT